MFLLMSPAMMYIAVYALAAILPAVFLMRYIYSQDHSEKEPGYLLWSLALNGVLAALAALVLEKIGDYFLSQASFADVNVYAAVTALGVGIIEEGCKMFFLYRRTWNDPNFNFRYDGVVYAVFVSLGFAAFENILYVFMYGLSVAVSRAFLAIPAHMGFAVFMGAFYGRAKLADVRGNHAGKAGNLIAGYLIAVCLHAFYDATAMMNSKSALVLFIVFVAVMYVVVYRLVKSESQHDKEIY